MADWSGQVVVLPEVAAWMETLSRDGRARLGGVLEALEAIGPSLRQPKVDRIDGNPCNNHVTMFELKCQNPHLRVLFVFDPTRTAVLLYGGDKSEDAAWKKWYRPAIRAACATYAAYLAQHYPTHRASQKAPSRRPSR
jgi:hypothetical protein